MTVTIRGEHDQATLDHLERTRQTGADFVALCADGHQGYCSHPVGGVVAYKDRISISGVGVDIGCGNTAIKLDVPFSAVKDSLPQIAKDIARNISFGMGQNNGIQAQHPLLEKDSHPGWDIPFVNQFKRKAANQLGTVGSGNHYVDVFVDVATDSVWIGVHFGSRGLGHTIATHYLKEAGGSDGVDAPPTLVAADSIIGEEYMMAMQLAGLYAEAGREWVVKYIAEHIFKSGIADTVENHHNFCWKETHFNEDYYVVRKGSTPAFPGQRGFVGGSMGDMSVILAGIDSADSQSMLYSTVHGSGRILSRTQAAGKQRWIKDAETGKRVMTRDTSTALVNEDSMRRAIAGRNTILIGGGADEAPQCYRPLRDVLKHHSGTIKIDHVLTPVIVVMAGAGEVDPYKD